MAEFIPFDQFESECKFPHKSSRVPCKGDDSGGELPDDGTYGLMGQVSGWVRPESGEFPSIIITGSNSIMVPSGSGYIVNPLTGTREVKWDAQQIVLSRVATSWITTVAINEAGEIVQLDGNISPEWARSHVILGTVTHVNGYADAIHMTPAIWGAVPYAAYDLAMASRNTIMEGGSVHPSTASGLSLDLLPRKMFFYGGSMNQPMDSNTIRQGTQTRVAFFPVTGQSNSTPLVTDLPVTLYNPNGGSTIETIPGEGDEATAFRLYQLGNRYLLLYGQHFYENLQECAAQAPYEAVVYPSKMAFGKLLAIICVRRDAVDLSDPNDSVIITNPPEGGEGSSDSGSLAIHFFFEGDGEQTDFFFPGADAEGAPWYDTYLEKTSGERDFIGQEPDVDFSIELGEHEEFGPGAWLKFAVAPGENIRGFSVFRSAGKISDGGGGGSPLIVQTITADTLVDGEHPQLLLVSTAESNITVTLKKKTESDDFIQGSTVSVLQWGSGQVTTVIEDDEGEMKIPVLFTNKTRAVGSTTTAACTYPDADQWSMSGDLAPDTDMGDGWFYADLLNSWANYGDGFGPVRYRKDFTGMVTVEGVCGDGLDATVFYLPEGFRPSDILIFACSSEDGVYSIRVSPDGMVAAQNYGSAEFISLSGVQFSVAG